MRVTPSVLSDPPRFDPVYITHDDLEDLSTFTGMSRDACLERLRTYSPSELAAQWRRASPTTPEEILDFYRSTDLYIWELMQWHASPSRRPYWEALNALVREFPPQDGWHRVCDFGCGIGTDALFLAYRGYSVTIVDVEGPTLQFARHRFERRGLNVVVQPSESMLPDPMGTFDVAVCFDVFEHLADPGQAADNLVRALRNGGILVQEAHFGDDGHHPCHLEAGVKRFAGLRWHIHLAGLGLRSLRPHMYVKTTGSVRLLQTMRYTIWRATGLWTVWSPP